METPPHGSTQLRESFRVKYPLGYPARLMPQVVLQPTEPATLEDWSENGMRLNIEVATRKNVGDTVGVLITVSSGEKIEAAGTVVWADEKIIAVRFIDFVVPWKLLLDEQRAIANWQATRRELI